MARFALSKLKPETRGMYESLSAFKRRNIKKTLCEHDSEIEESLEMLGSLEIWNNELRQTSVATNLLPEIWMDGYVSISFAMMGLYKYANTSLRSSIETTLRLVYFVNHPVEYEWWKKEINWHTQYSFTDVYGRKYEYFARIFQAFEKECSPDKKALFGDDGQCLKTFYGALSGFIHTSPRRFQTKPTMFSPRYDIGRFNEWLTSYKQTQTYINVLLALAFPAELKNMHVGHRSKVLEKGMLTYYRDKVKKVLTIT